MGWTVNDFRAIERLLVEEYPVPTEFDYADGPDWERGAYDEWNTMRLKLADLCEERGGLTRNGNRKFDRYGFLQRTDIPTANKIVRRYKERL